MRYPKGSLQLSQSRDLPLLRQLLRSEFVTHSQLFAFMQLNHHERSRHSFDWRVRRLLDRELIRRQTLPTIAGEYVYSIAASAAIFLQNIGEYCLVGRDRFGGKEVERSVFHAIGLNEIQLSLLRAGLLIRWIGSMEVRSQNELTGFGFAKDYDAVVTVQTETGDERFALEYERNPKVGQALSRDRRDGDERDSSHSGFISGLELRSSAVCVWLLPKHAMPRPVRPRAGLAQRSAGHAGLQQFGASLPESPRNAFTHRPGHPEHPDSRLPFRLTFHCPLIESPLTRY